MSGLPVTGGAPWCNITFNLSTGWTPTQAMTYDASTKLFNYTRNFTQLGDIPWNVTCNATFYQSRIATNNVTINMTTVNATSPANATMIDRDSVSAAVGDNTTLIAQIPYAPAGINVSFYANMTTPTIAGQYHLLIGWNLTNASGIATYTWDPNSSIHYAGNYTWFANATNSTMQVAYFNATGYVYVYGGLNVTFYDALYNPNATYATNQSVIVQGVLLSRGLETNATVNTSYLAVVNSTFFKTDLTNTNISLSYNLTSGYGMYP
jgi:hypothetical protein